MYKPDKFLNIELHMFQWVGHNTHFRFLLLGSVLEALLLNMQQWLCFKAKSKLLPMWLT